MPLLKGKSSKSTPSAVMQYVTNPEKAAYVSVRNLFEDEDYAEQFTETMRRFNKGKSMTNGNIIISSSLATERITFPPKKLIGLPRN